MKHGLRIIAIITILTPFATSCLSRSEKSKSEVQFGSFQTKQLNDITSYFIHLKPDEEITICGSHREEVKRAILLWSASTNRADRHGA